MYNRLNNRDDKLFIEVPPHAMLNVKMKNALNTETNFGCSSAKSVEYVC